MNGLLRSSTIRLGIGSSMAVLAVAFGLFLLPDASQKRIQKQNAFKEAQAQLENQQKALAAAQAEADRIAKNEACLEDLLASMPAESVGELQWRLSKELYGIAQKSSTHLRSVKYGSPSREGVKGTDLEVLDVEFGATGIYSNLKSFMLALEGSKLPFAVVNAKLEEGPDGARLNVTLRAFRRSGAVTADSTRENA